MSIESDKGGEAVLKWLSTSRIRERAKVVRLENAKDASALYLASPEGFLDAWKHALKNAVEWTELARNEVPQELTQAITLRPGEHPDAVDAAEEVLMGHAERLRIYQRGGEIVQVIRREEGWRSAGIDRQPGTVILKPIMAVALTEIWDRLITWQRLARGNSGPEAVRVDFPGRIAAAYLSRFGSWRLPFLTGVISTPVLRHDGSVLHHAGYDTQTGLYLTEDWPEINRHPSREDALEALRVLDQPFSEFPFVAEDERSVLRAAILAAIQRHGLPSCPLFGFTAPVQRTGKSLLAECVAIIATGRPAPAMAVAGDREEMRKAVLSVLPDGHAIVKLDNIEHPLASPDLARAITQPEYQDRLLGETKTLRLPTNVLWTATGNNLTFRGDLAVRALVCRLDAQDERPEERHFKTADLKRYVAETRPRLVVAALTILHAYVMAGRPDQNLTPWGGFDEWSATVRAPLVWLGMADPCLTRQHVIEDDPDREHAAALLSAWSRCFGGKPVLVAQVVERASTDPDLRTALLAVAASKGDSKEIDPRRVSWWCRDWRGRVIGGKRVERGKDYGDHKTYGVTAVNADSAVKPGRTKSDDKPSDEEKSNCWEANNRTNRNYRKVDPGVETDHLGFEGEDEAVI